MENSIITQMTSVFNDVFGWLSQALKTVLSVFYDATTEKLTILGVLAIVGLAIAIFMLVMNIISNFFHLRG